MILILLVPNTMAFGGVAIGNMNAIDADSVAGIIRNKGLMPVVTDKPANTGNNISVVAVFDVSSVRKVIKRQMIIVTIKG